jgi:adenylyltransferase/sulfurtransferase
VLGVLPGVIGSLQALEAIKLVVGMGEPLVGRLLLFDALRTRFRELAVRKDPDCPLCSATPSISGLIDYEAFCGLEPLTPHPDRELSVRELHEAMVQGRGLQLLDVRERHEHEIVRFPGSRLIPLRELPSRHGELDPRADLVAYCHHGTRSLRAVDVLRKAGFPRVRSLAGGIDAWAAEVDPAMPRY